MVVGRIQRVERIWVFDKAFFWLVGRLKWVDGKWSTSQTLPQGGWVKLLMENGGYGNADCAAFLLGEGDGRGGG